MNWKVMGALAAVLALALSALYVNRTVAALRPKGTDLEQIQAVLLKGESAAERGDSAALGRLISDNYRDSLGMTETQMRYQMGDYLRRHASIDVELPANSIQADFGPDGKTAAVRFHARVSARGEGGQGTMDIDPVLGMTKEPVRYLWVFPGEEWKVTSAEGYAGLDGM
jgi:hypothetical protein